MSKPGYRIIPPVSGKGASSELFEYGLSSRTRHQPSKERPTIFILHKVGVVEPLVKVGEKDYRIARDGSPLSISLDLYGGHQVVLRCWNKGLLRTTPKREYDWSLEIRVPTGGLIPREDTFGFQAPAEGYTPSDTVTMAASLGIQWRSFVERSYFVRFDDGTFARAKLEMHAAGDHFVVWESFLNNRWLQESRVRPMTADSQLLLSVSSRSATPNCARSKSCSVTIPSSLFASSVTAIAPVVD